MSLLQRCQLLRCVSGSILGPLQLFLSGRRICIRSVDQGPSFLLSHQLLVCLSLLFC